ncbi:TPA: helix-turn-helix domain-containing protein [Escherichia coli]
MKHAVKVMDEIAAQIQESGSLLGMIYSYMSENGAESERVYNAIRCLMRSLQKTEETASVFAEKLCEAKAMVSHGHFFGKIRAQREACGLTTTELARLLDLDEEIILQWESGEFEPTISMLIPLANVLGCDPLSLLSENNTAVPVRVNAPEAHMESIGTRIKSARKKLGLTESDLARMINTYSDPINDWECGICEVPADQIVPLASALNCDLMWLLTGKSEAKE